MKEKRQEKLVETLGSAWRGGIQSLLVLPVLCARSQGSSATLQCNREWGSCPAPLLQQPVGPAVIILGGLAC